MKVSVLGIGSLRAGPPLLAGLATFHGERPIELTICDPDEERLDLFDRFARTLFTITEVDHALSATSDWREAIEADAWVICFGQNAAAKWLGRWKPHPFSSRDFKSRQELIRSAWDLLELDLLESERLLDLVRRDAATELASDDRMRMPHKILRWIKADEPVFDLTKEHNSHPVKPWLEGLTNPRLK